MRRRVLAVLAIAVVTLACRASEPSKGSSGGGPAGWAHGTWRFSRDVGSPSTGWVEFAPEGRKGILRVIDYMCPTEARCKTEGTFEAGEGSITLHVRQWDKEPFKVRATDTVMEWTRNDIAIVRLVFQPPVVTPPPDPQLDLPISCKSDADCPTSLACGPCKADEPILGRSLRVECYRNPCPGHHGYCRADRICAVKP